MMTISTKPSQTIRSFASRLGKGLLLLALTFLATGSFAQLQVLEPSLPGISLVSNASYTVRWSRGGTTFTEVDIQYSSDGGSTYTTLVIASPSTSTDTSEVITVPGMIGNTNKIRVRKRSDNSQSDVSDNNFTITGFCWPLGMSCSTNYMEQVIFNTLNSSSTCNTSRAYVNYGKAGARTTTVQLGLTYSFKVRSNKTNTNMGFGIWADWNNDSDFADAGEHLYSSPSLDTTFSGSITIPTTIATGDIRFRTRCVRGFIPGAADYCTYYNAGGEIEDYTITISRPVILTNTFLPATPCPGATFNVPFTTTGVFQPGNSYTAQLSLPGGSFTSATNIGFGTSSPISVTIPVSTQPGTYYIRVLSSNPNVFGQRSNLITVKSRPNPPSTAGATRCGDGTLILSAIGCSTYSWFSSPSGGTSLGSSSSFTTPTLSNSTNYYAQCTNPVNGCVSLRTLTSAVVNPLPVISNFTPLSGIVDYDAITITGTGLSAIDSLKFFDNQKSTQVTTNIAGTTVTTKAPVGTSTGAITIYTGCGSATSASTFTPIVPSISAPTPSQAGGTYANAINVSLTTSTSGADIYYTLNGATPVPNTSGTYKYSSAIFIGNNLTLKAIGYRSGWTTSSVTTTSYTITNKVSAAKPEIDPPGDAYEGAQLITITSSTPEAKIYFTLTGNTPVVGAGHTKLYLGPFTIIQPAVTIKAIAVREGWVNSAVTTESYTITNAQVLPVCSFDPAPGTFGAPVDVTISNPEPDVDIYFTLDGTEPTRYNPTAQLFSGLVPISNTRTLKARAYKTGFGESAQTVGVYTIGSLRKAVGEMASVYFTDNSLSYGQNTDGDFENLNESNLSALHIYPNPGTGIYFIDFKKGVEKSEIQVVNMMGQEVLKQKSMELSYGTTLDLTGNRSGFYLVRLKDQDGNVTEKKIVLQ